MDWHVVIANMDLLLQGLKNTLHITIAVTIIGVIAGMALCVMRRATSRWLAAAAKAYIAFFRITPELALIFWAYFCLPPLFGLMLSGWLSGTLALGLVAAAYFAEIYRAGIESIARGQWEAGEALGLNRSAVWIKVVLPQALRRMIPALVNYLTEIIKNSTLLAGVGVAEMAYQAYTLGAQTFRYVELLSSIAMLFFIIIFPISLYSRRIERKMVR
ncbi:MAG: amino acid ABC transporter permease [Parvibaculaceae bacterium]